MTDHSNQISRRKLPLYTFTAVFLAIVLTGLIVVPALIRRVEYEYLVLQADVNARQARSLAKFVDDRLMQGLTEEEVIQEFQTVIADSDADLGFSCLIDQASGRFISHPMVQVVGMSVAAKSADFESWRDEQPRDRWESVIQRGVSGAGLLLLPEDRSEVVYMFSIPGTRWTVSTHENTERLREELAKIRFAMIAGSFGLALLFAFPASAAARRVGRRYEARIEEQNEIISIEREKSEALLLNILPEAVAEELKAGKETIAERHPNVTVLFADLVGFTPLASSMPAEDLVQILNRIFSEFDDLACKHGLEKIKTIGDEYMVCGGLNDVVGDSAGPVAEMALDLVEATRELGRELGLDLKIRIGVNTGEVVAGVIGKQKFIYDLWGDVVNTANRMQSSGVADRIQVTKETWQRLRDRYDFEDRGTRDFKGKGRLHTWLLRGRPAV